MQNDNGWKWRAWLTLALVIVGLFFSSVYNKSKPIIDGRAATAQVNGGDADYVASTYILHAQEYMWIPGIIILVLIWVPWVMKVRHYDTCSDTGNNCKDHKCSCKTALIFLALIPLCLVGCMGPPQVDVFDTVGPNETAFVIPLQGDNKSSQAQFNSAEYLNTKKVAAKRIVIPTMMKITGRFTSVDYEWVPAVTVFKVERSLVSREWTSGKTGTSEKNQGIPVVTKDGIQLTLGVAVTTFIEEDDAAMYLYYHGLQKLPDVTDNNVRNFCITELTREYGMIDLSDAKSAGPRIFAQLFKDAKEHFKAKGITISQLGNAEGYQFQNPTIQESINKAFTAQQDIQTAEQEKLAQDARNKKILATAENQASAAKKLFDAQEATKFQNQLEIQMMTAKAQLAMAEKWNGALPANILPANSPLLMSLGSTSSATSTNLPAR